MVLAFEATNGFHDASNAVATVIYTRSLKPVPAVVWSGVMNFVGVMAGGIAVAYALVEILPPDVLTPPDGTPAVPMLVSIFVSALFWNILTWAFGIPNSSSHCIVGSLIGVAASDALLKSRSLVQGVDWKQIGTVLEGLAISPVLGGVLAGGLYLLLRVIVRSGALFAEPAEPLEPSESSDRQGDRAPVWWLRALLILTCSSVSFSHGTNDGQKTIGLIMLAIIGLLPATYALNPQASGQVAQLGAYASAAIPLIDKYGNDVKAHALRSAAELRDAGPLLHDQATQLSARRHDAQRARAQDAQNGAGYAGERTVRARLRGDIYDVVAQLKHIGELDHADPAARRSAALLLQQMSPPVQYAPTWVRVLSALCLGLGTMIGYKRVVRTLGEGLGKARMNPAQGLSAELVGSVLIGTAGLTGLPVSTTHIVTSGIAGAMLAGGKGLQRGMLLRILLTWLLTLPATMLLSGALFFFLAKPALT